MRQPTIPPLRRSFAANSQPDSAEISPSNIIDINKLESKINQSCPLKIFPSVGEILWSSCGALSDVVLTYSDNGKMATACSLPQAIHAHSVVLTQARFFRDRLLGRPCSTQHPAHLSMDLPADTTTLSMQALHLTIELMYTKRFSGSIRGRVPLGLAVLATSVELGFDEGVQEAWMWLAEYCFTHANAPLWQRLRKQFPHLDTTFAPAINFSEENGKLVAKQENATSPRSPLESPTEARVRREEAEFGSFPAVTEAPKIAVTLAEAESANDITSRQSAAVGLIRQRERRNTLTQLAPFPDNPEKGSMPAPTNKNVVKGRERRSFSTLSHNPPRPFLQDMVRRSSFSPPSSVLPVKKDDSEEFIPVSEFPATEGPLFAPSQPADAFNGQGEAPVSPGKSGLSIMVEIAKFDTKGVDADKPPSPALSKVAPRLRERRSSYQPPKPDPQVLAKCAQPMDQMSLKRRELSGWLTKFENMALLPVSEAVAKEMNAGGLSRPTMPFPSVPGNAMAIPGQANMFTQRQRRRSSRIDLGAAPMTLGSPAGANAPLVSSPLASGPIEKAPPTPFNPILANVMSQDFLVERDSGETRGRRASMPVSMRSSPPLNSLSVKLDNSQLGMAVSRPRRANSLQDYAPSIIEAIISLCETKEISSSEALSYLFRVLDALIVDYVRAQKSSNGASIVLKEELDKNISRLAEQSLDSSEKDKLKQRILAEDKEQKISWKCTKTFEALITL